MTEFVLEYENTSKNWGACSGCHQKGLTEDFFLYANFLNQPLTLGMFIPCDSKGKPLKEPFTVGAKMKHHQLQHLDKFKQAKERVLFEGFRLTDGKSNTVVCGEVSIYLDYDHKAFKIENLSTYHLTLTASAIKIIGL